MAGFFDAFRKTVVSSVWEDPVNTPSNEVVDDKIALGVLLWVVAEADEQFLPQEEEKIKDVLKRYSNIQDKDIEVILASVERAAKDRIDLYQFTSEISDNLPYKFKLSIIKDLFRVAFSDNQLDDRELETIRKISGLLHVS
ncbi:MAG: TerB family tellurite resistance protein, partial [Candidatus Omnitrophota bacterium]